MKRIVFAQITFEGLHHWPDCDIEEVSYLRDKHRHLFYVKAEKTVNHNDRDTEFIWLKHRINEEIRTWGFDLGSMSCEMMAEKLIKRFDLSACEVLEDNENGVRLEIESTDNLI